MQAKKLNNSHHCAKERIVYNSSFRDENLFSPSVVHNLVNRFAKCSRSYSDVVKKSIQAKKLLLVNKVDSVKSKLD